MQMKFLWSIPIILEVQSFDMKGEGDDELAIASALGPDVTYNQHYRSNMDHKRKKMKK